MRKTLAHHVTHDERSYVCLAHAFAAEDSFMENRIATKNERNEDFISGVPTTIMIEQAFQRSTLVGVVRDSKQVFPTTCYVSIKITTG